VKKSIYLFLLLVPLMSFASEKRCGWLDNPSPAHLWLIDKDGSWSLSIQGGYSVDDESMDNIPWPSENEDEFVRTNNNYGFSCACLDVEVDRGKLVVLKVISGEHLLLKRCLEDIDLSKSIPLRFQ